MHNAINKQLARRQTNITAAATVSPFKDNVDDGPKDEDKVKSEKEERNRLVDLKMEEMKLKNEQWSKRLQEIEEDKQNANASSKMAFLKLQSQEKNKAYQKPLTDSNLPAPPAKYQHGVPKGETIKTKQQGIPTAENMRLQMNMTGAERLTYQNWQQERQQIDQDRLARQKRGGEWRREWDSDKQEFYELAQDTPPLSYAPVNYRNPGYTVNQKRYQRFNSNDSGRASFGNPYDPPVQSSNQNQGRGADDDSITFRRGFGDQPPSKSFDAAGGGGRFRPIGAEELKKTLDSDGKWDRPFEKSTSWKRGGKGSDGWQESRPATNKNFGFERDLTNEKRGGFGRGRARKRDTEENWDTPSSQPALPLNKNPTNENEQSFDVASLEKTTGGGVPSAAHVVFAKAPPIVASKSMPSSSNVCNRFPDKKNEVPKVIDNSAAENWDDLPQRASSSNQSESTISRPPTNEKIVEAERQQRTYEEKSWDAEIDAYIETEFTNCRKESAEAGQSHLTDRVEQASVDQCTSSTLVGQSIYDVDPDEDDQWEDVYCGEGSPEQPTIQNETTDSGPLSAEFEEEGQFDDAVEMLRAELRLRGTQANAIGQDLKHGSIYVSPLVGTDQSPLKDELHLDYLTLDQIEQQMIKDMDEQIKAVEAALDDSSDEVNSLLEEFVEKQVEELVKDILIKL